MTLGWFCLRKFPPMRTAGPVNDTFMQFRVQYHDDFARVIHELHAEARDAICAISLVCDLEWPSHALTTRVLDGDGREVHSKVKGDTQG